MITKQLKRRSSNARWLAWIFVPLGLLFVAANTHLVYVAVVSQPDCVDHIKAPGEGQGYRAAKSAC